MSSLSSSDRKFSNYLTLNLEIQLLSYHPSYGLTPHNPSLGHFNFDVDFFKKWHDHIKV